MGYFMAINKTAGTNSRTFDCDTLALMGTFLDT